MSLCPCYLTIDYIFWHAFRSDPLWTGFLWVFCVALGLILKRIVKVLGNWYKISSAIWKLIFWAPFSATLQYDSRIVACAIKQRNKKPLKLTCCGSGDPIASNCKLLKSQISLVYVRGENGVEFSLRNR